ncbi:MAG: hypothetical protein HKN52_10895 [Eudoraea sp.]|nr:hypothetical protein [Eudoraea sp.]
MSVRKLLLLLFFPFLLFTTACNQDDSIDPIVIIETENEPSSEDPAPEDPEPPEVMGTIEVFNSLLMYDGLVLVNDAKNNRAFLMDKNALLVHEWPITTALGNDAFLNTNGKILASLEAEDPKITLGGQGGKVQFIAADGTVEWNFDYSSPEAETHHDAELLPNGNVIVLVWEKKTLEEATAAGSNSIVDVFPEAVIEIDPLTDEIVWEWHAWDHLVQDFDDTKDNYGLISSNPRLIDLNYVSIDNGDIMHANGLDYDPIKDVIYISANFFSEVWVIDHSTTAAEAASHSGGNYGIGGDLVYRFGNPSAYDNIAGERLFNNNHYPNLLTGSDEGKMLIFSNGNGLDQSTAYELQLPEVFTLEANTNNEPEVIWSFTDPDLFSPKVSGVVKLPNGNRLITEGDFGIWEVTNAGEVVWKFSADGFFWRAYHYDKDAPEIISLGL